MSLYFFHAQSYLNGTSWLTGRSWQLMIFLSAAFTRMARGTHDCDRGLDAQLGRVAEAPWCRARVDSAAADVGSEAGSAARCIRPCDARALSEGSRLALRRRSAVVK